MQTTQWLLSAIFGLLLVGSAAAQTAPTQEERQALAPTGKLRIGFVSTSPVHVTQVSGEQRGVAIDVGKELARRLGVPYEWVGYSSVKQIVLSAQTDQWDVIFFAATPARAKLMDFSPPLVEVEIGYLVPAGSSLYTLADVDKPGIRIAVLVPSVVDEHLSASLKSATLLRVPSPADPADLVASGKADAFAHLKPFLFRSLAKVPGLRVLDGHIFFDRISIAVPKDRSISMAYVRRFVEDVKASGLVKDAIDRAGLRAVVVAPSQ